MSRAAIADETGISKPTISESAQRLLKQSLIVEMSKRSNGHQGRSAILYDINAQRGHSLGFALERGRIGARALNLKGDTIWEFVETPSQDATREHITDFVKSTVHQSQKKLHTEQLSIGFSVADPVNPVSGNVVALPDSPFPSGQSIDFLKDFGIQENFPVCIDNDVNWATLAERAYGCMKDEDNFIFIYLGAGIGAGLYLSGYLHRGAQGMAGEIGYLDYGTGKSLMHLIIHEGLGATGDDFLDLNAVNRLFQQKKLPPQAEIILDEIGKAVIAMSTILNPAAVVLGGPLTHCTPLSQGLQKRITENSLLPITVKKSDMPDLAPLVGVSIGAHELAMVRLGMIQPSLENLHASGFMTMLQVPVYPSFL